MKLESVEEDSSAEENENRQTLIVTSDVHTNCWQFGNRGGTGLNNTRLQRTLSVLNKTLQEARNRDAIWLSAGDLTHRQGVIQNEILNALRDVFSEFYDVPKVIVYGDHDSRGTGMEPTTEDETALSTLADAVENLTLLERQRMSLRDDPRPLTIYGEGSQPQDSHYDLNHPADICLSHGVVDGSKTASGYEMESSISASQLLDNYKLSIIGDIHKPNTIWRDDRVVLIPGSLEQQKFGEGGLSEDGKRGYWRVEMEYREDGWYVDELEHIDSGSPRFVTVEDPDDIPEDSPHYYRVKGAHKQDVSSEDEKVLSSPPSTVDERDLLADHESAEDVVISWVEENEPPTPISETDAIKTGQNLVSEAEINNLISAQVRHIESENFLSFKNFSHSYKTGVTLVTGESSDHESNGAGKTALTGEALYWCLTGKTTKGVSASDVIRWDNDSKQVPDGRRCTVTATIDLGDQDLVVQRSRTKSGIDVEASVGGDPIKGTSARETTNKIHSLLGITPDSFKALSYFSQEETILLPRERDSTRKEILATFLGLDGYEEASSLAREQAKEAREEIDRLDSKIETLEEEVGETEDELEEIREKSEQWQEKKEARLKELKETEKNRKETKETEIEQLGHRFDSVFSRAKELKETWEERREDWADRRATELKNKRTKKLRHRIEEVRTSMEPEEKAEKWRSRVENFNEEAYEEKLEDAREEVDEKEDQRAEASGDLDRVKFRLERRESELGYFTGEGDDSGETFEELLEEGTCPKCQQEVTEEHVEQLAEELAEDVRELTEEKELFEERLSEAKEELEQAEQRLEKIEAVGEKYEDARTHLKFRRQSEDEIERLEEQIEQAEDDARERAREEATSRFESDVRRIKDFVERAEEYVERRKEELEDAVEEIEEKIARVEEKESPHAGSLKTLQGRIADLWEKIDNAEEDRLALKEERDLYEYWSDGFSKTGIQSLLLEEIASEFNRARTEVFPMLTSGTFDVQFSTRSETQSGEVREKTEFVVRMNGKKVPYANLSGGQRKRVDIGTMISLVLAASRAWQVPGVLGILILDECMSMLDSQATENLANVLEEVSETIPSIYVITHDDSLASHFSQRVHVKQNENGVSRISA